MRYRALDANGDYSFGSGQANFLVNSPAAVGQLVLTNLLLMEGEWFLDTTVGTPYLQQILGKGTSTEYDMAIQDVVLNTQGVTEIVAYTSTYNSATRALTVQMTIDTVYGQTQVTGAFA